MATEKQKVKILEKLNADRKKKMVGNITDSLIEFFKADLPVYDIDYIERRLREVIETGMKNMDFYFEGVDKAKRAMLKEMLDKLKVSLPAKREFRKKSDDLTEQRDARCEPLVYELLGRFLDEKILLDDEEYLKESIKEQSEVLFQVVVAGYLKTLFEGIAFSAETSLRTANEVLWGGKSKEQITWKEVDKVLKSKNTSAPVEDKK